MRLLQLASPPNTSTDLQASGSEFKGGTSAGVLVLVGNHEQPVMASALELEYHCLIMSSPYAWPYNGVTP